MNEPIHLLIVDDDSIIVESLSEFLRLEGYVVDGAESARRASALLDQQAYQVVITDVNMSEADGFDLLRTIKEKYAETVVIMITGYGTIDSAVEAIKLGAYDYLTKPIIDDEIRLVVERAVRQQALIRENRDLRRRLDLRYGLDNIVGHDYQMLKIFDLIEAVADSTTTVMIQGESGTGKSLIARAIHYRSGRREMPFIEVSCGALPETLLESELFGHVRGAFTNAVSDKEGKFKAADRGTIFLDEISTASPALQVKLLRVLQERQFEPVGSNQTHTVDVRVTLASNTDLSTEVDAGRFRQDLYYRVNVVTISVPPLRERIGDIPLLADFFLKKYCAQLRKEILGLTDETIGLMQRYPWKGNVRELENCIERAVVLSKGRYITPDDLPANILDQRDAGRLPCGPHETLPLKQALEEPEKRIIQAALQAHAWNRQATAEALEINRTTLYKKMKRYGLETDAVTAGRGV